MEAFLISYQIKKKVNKQQCKANFSHQIAGGPAISEFFSSDKFKQEEKSSLQDFQSI